MVLLNSFWTKIGDFFNALSSVLIAIARLTFLAVIFYISGLQEILFNRLEIVNLCMKSLPWRCAREGAMDKLAYIDKLCIENPELMDITDDYYNDGLDHIDPDDFDAGEGEN